MFNNFFSPKIVASWDIVEQFGKGIQATDDNGG